MFSTLSNVSVQIWSVCVCCWPVPVEMALSIVFCAIPVVFVAVAFHKI